MHSLVVRLTQGERLYIGLEEVGCPNPYLLLNDTYLKHTVGPFGFKCDLND